MNNNLLYILTILESIEKIFIYKNGFNNADSFYKANDQQAFNATLNLLAAVGEESKKISDDLKSQTSEINWISIIAFRNELVHNYRNINKNIVWSILTKELEPLKAACLKMLKIIKPEKTKLTNYLSSDYYSHLNYLKNEI